MYNFDDLGKKISELNEYTNALIAKTGLSYSEFAVLYTRKRRLFDSKKDRRRVAHTKTNGL